jgi:RNA polymerase sigma factor (sigma-70 family)
LKRAQPAFWTGLISDHYSALTAYFRRRISLPAEAEDLVQEVYCRLLRCGQSHPDGVSIRNPEAYLFTVAENLLREQRVLRRRAEQHLDLSGVAPSLLSVDDTSESAMERTLLERGLSMAFSRLTPRQRVVFVMHYREGLTYPEIAAKLGVSTNMVKKYVVRGLMTFRSSLASFQAGSNWT